MIDNLFIGQEFRIQEWKQKIRLLEKHIAEPEGK